MAIKLSKQRRAELIILQVYHLLKPFKWTTAAFERYAEQFREKTVEELKTFIADIYKAMEEAETGYQLALVSNLDVVDGIREYADKHNCDYVCISTRGAGTLAKLFGTHTAKLISSSTIPVLCIPSTYHLRDLKHFLYASDMSDYENELKKVVDFARPLHASIDMVHIAYPDEFTYDRELAEATLRKKADYQVSLLTPERDMTRTLLEDIDRAIRSVKPSLLVLFNHHSRSVFEKLFFPSNAEEYSFYGKIPLLTFNKREGK